MHQSAFGLLSRFLADSLADLIGLLFDFCNTLVTYNHNTAYDLSFISLKIFYCCNFEVRASEQISPKLAFDSLLATPIRGSFDQHSEST